MNVKPQMALLCFAVVIIMLIYALIYNKKMKSAFKENRVRMGEINSQIEDSLSGIRVVKSFGNEKREIEKFRKGNERFVDSKRVTYRYMAGYHAGMDAFTTLITVTALVSGAMFLAAGDLSATDPVSYTHLDVYKRQAAFSQGFLNPAISSNLAHCLQGRTDFYIW